MTDIRQRPPRPRWHRPVINASVLIIVLIVGIVAGAEYEAHRLPPATSTTERLATSSHSPDADRAAAGRPVPCAVTVSRRHPADGAQIRIRIRTAPHSRIILTRVRADEQGSRAGPGSAGRRNRASADQTGRHIFRYRIADDAAAHRMDVSVSVGQGSRSGSCGSWYTPRP